MKKLSFLLYAAILSLAFIGCSAELPNMECDIEQCWIHIEKADSFFSRACDTLIVMNEDRVADSVIFTISKNVELTDSVPLYFSITPNATIYQIEGTREIPFKNGSKVNLKSTHLEGSTRQTFVVRSEDGAWNRTYQVGVEIAHQTFYPSEGFKFNFDSYSLEPSKKKYYVWRETNFYIGDNITWSNGNPGFAISKGSATPVEYPSVPSANGGVDSCACLILSTLSTGTLGKAAKMPIAAGNFFIGSFDSGQAMRAPLKATKFGVPFDHKPLSVEGYYKYVQGPVMTDKNMATLAKEDTCDIYAVLFRNVDAAGNAVVLNGGDVKTNPNIIGLADIDPATINFLPKGSKIENEKWSTFNIKFNYTDEPVYEDLINGRYSLTIVFSSSKGGASFEGAIGSTLYIDNVTLKCDY